MPKEIKTHNYDIGKGLGQLINDIKVVAT